MFECLEVAHQVVEMVVPIVAKVEKRDRELADQLRRAANSVVWNLSEGAGHIGGRRLDYYRHAHGSACEAASQLRLAVTWGHVDDVKEPLELLDRVRAMLWRLTH